jgi:hypothetical protein
MRIIPVSEPVHRSGAKGAGALTRAIEKTNPSSALQRQPQQAPQPEPRPLPRIQVELVSQNGTACFDPLWDGPRLLPSFVAQVMGQVMNQAMPERRTSLSLETAYGSARLARMALLVDRRS